MKRFICILLASVMGLCCFSCADSNSDSNAVGSAPHYGLGCRVRSTQGYSVYSYYYYPQNKIVLSVGETYILEAVFLLLSLHGDYPSDELSCPEFYDAWIEEYDENCLQITRRYDLDNDFGRYYELVPICEIDDMSFVIRLGESASQLGYYNNIKLQIVA